jgi:hypothetical protein
MLQQLQCRTTPLAANLLKQKPDYAHDHKNLREVPTAQSTEAPPAILDAQQLPIRDSNPEVSSLADMKQVDGKRRACPARAGPGSFCPTAISLAAVLSKLLAWGKGKGTGTSR